MGIDRFNTSKKWWIYFQKEILKQIVSNFFKAPFYPREASEKGASPSEYGFVFGIIHLAIFIW